MIVQQKDLFGKGRTVIHEQSECAFQIQLVAILRWAIRPDVVWYHVPNGERRDIRTAQKLKAMGTLAGISDLQFHWAEIDPEYPLQYPRRKLRRVLHLELKVGNGKRSEAQLGYALAMSLMGDECHVARSVDEAITILGERGLIRNDVEVCGRRW